MLPGTDTSLKYVGSHRNIPEIDERNILTSPRNRVRSNASFGSVVLVRDEHIKDAVDVEDVTTSEVSSPPAGPRYCK